MYLTQQPSQGLSRSSSSAGSVQSNIPGLLSCNFVAREQDLWWIALVFESDVATNGTRRAAVYGITSVGKSQLVINPFKVIFEFCLTSRLKDPEIRGEILWPICVPLLDHLRFLWEGPGRGSADTRYPRPPRAIEIQTLRARQSDPFLVGKNSQLAFGVW